MCCGARYRAGPDPGRAHGSFERRFAVTILEGYGLSETSSTTTFNISAAERKVDFVRQRVAAYKYPRTVELRGSLAKGATGKILKKELRPA